MASLEPFVLRIKPAMDAFLRNATKQNLKTLETELSQFNWIQMSIFNMHILVPLVLKLEELSNDNQDLRTGCLQCITLVTSKIYLKELEALKTMLFVSLKQVREGENLSIKPNLSEEIKLATVKCIMECLKRSTSDVLERFYTKDSTMILGQILLTLVEFIEKEKYKKLVLASLECLMTVFYVHDEADRLDVVLRNQVANTIFIFLPKIVTVLCKMSIADNTLGEAIKINSIKAIGRILCVIYEETSENLINAKYDVEDFKKLLRRNLNNTYDSNADNDILAFKKDRAKVQESMKQLQEDGRTQQWIQATSKKLCIIFQQTCKLRSHSSKKIRESYAEMCCLLMKTCSHNLKENFVLMLESVVALTEDEDVHIRTICCNCINELQNNFSNDGIFDENSELLFNEQLTKLPRVIARCDDTEQYMELTFLRGFFRIISPSKLQSLLSIPHNLEMFCMCLLSALDLQISSDLLIEEYSLRDIDVEKIYLESCKLPWRKFKNINSASCVKCLHEICCVLGKTPILNRIIVDYLLEMLHQQNAAMNEILLMLLWIVTAEEKNNMNHSILLVKYLLDELLDDAHCYLALEPDKPSQRQVYRHSDWIVDRTPGLYESAVEIRTEDCNSDDETEDILQKQQRVTIADAEFNVLHTCIVLDCLGHCALYLGESNSIVHQAATFALVSVQKSLRFNKVTHLIETHIDYITYHLNRLLKKIPESKSALDILTVLLQYSSRDNLPFLEVVLDTIYNECSKQCEAHNAVSYLKVFQAFLRHIALWLSSCDTEIKDNENMHIDDDDNKSKNKVQDCGVLTSWLDILKTDKPVIDIEQNFTTEEKYDRNTTKEEALIQNDAQLPRHIRLIISILKQTVKFLSNSELKIQILSLECLACGLPLLHDFENELLPLIHTTWPPLVEKFRQKNILVLDRCFSLLKVLALNAKDFIMKRCLSDVMPFLKLFLQEAALHSTKETNLVSTVKHKLQLQLLKEFPNIIECLNLDDKHLSEISELVVMFLAKEQPVHLQHEAIGYFAKLRYYNGPLVYLIVIKKFHFRNYKSNVKTILQSFDIKFET